MILVNNNQLKTYYKRVSYLLRIQQYPVDNTYNTYSNQTGKSSKIDINSMSS